MTTTTTRIDELQERAAKAEGLATWLTGQLRRIEAGARLALESGGSERSASDQGTLERIHVRARFAADSAERRAP